MTYALRDLLAFIRNCSAAPKRVAALTRQLATLSGQVAELRARLDADVHARTVDAARLDELLSIVRHRSAKSERSGFVYLGGFTGLATLASGLQLFVDTRDRQIVPHVVTHGVWEAWNTRLVSALLKPGDTFVEVGSNIGFFAVLAGSLIGESGCGHVFEAHPRLAELLKSSMEINGFASRLRVHPIAAGDQRGTASFLVQEHNLGAGHVLPPQTSHDIPGSTTIEVAVDTVDDIVPADFTCRLMHLDAEGSEPSILRGAKRLIERSPRLVIVTEWGFDTQGRREELEWLEAAGFKFWFVRHDLSLAPATVDDLASASLCDVLCARATLEELGV